MCLDMQLELWNQKAQIILFGFVCLQKIQIRANIWEIKKQLGRQFLIIQAQRGHLIKGTADQ